MPGSQFSNSDYLRSLGLTSLGMMGSGETALTGAVSRMPRTSLYDPTSLYTTPEQQYNAQLLANIYASAPVPAAANAAALAAGRSGVSAGRSAVPSIGSYTGGVGSGNAAASQIQNLVNRYVPSVVATQAQSGVNGGSASSYGVNQYQYASPLTPGLGTPTADDEWASWLDDFWSEPSNVQQYEPNW